MPKPVIVALDPDRLDTAPAVLGRGLAHLTGAPLVLVAIRPGRAATGSSVEDLARDHTIPRLRAVSEDLDAELVIAGDASPANAIERTARQHGAGVVVVGATRRGPLGRVAPGTTAARLLQHPCCPVAIAPHDLRTDWSPRRIGVGFVALDEGRRSLRIGAALARAAGAELQVVTALEPLAWTRTAAVPAYRTDGGPEGELRAAQRALDVAVAGVDAGVHTSTSVVHASPAQALETLSAEVDLLVCGARGFRPIHAALAGSATHRLLHSARCPVLLVPRGVDTTLLMDAARTAAAR